MNYKIFPVSENAVTIDFGNQVSVDLNQTVIELTKVIEADKFVGFIEAVPAYSSLTVFFDLSVVRKIHSNAFLAIMGYLEKATQNLPKLKSRKTRLVKIPVDYSTRFAPDLEFVAQYANLTIREVIEIHTSEIYRVFMVGFLPAFAYMGEVDERIAAPRQQTPRTKVEKGSVGIAGRQTGIYPLDCPGGWQIIGKTDLEIFQPKKQEISLLKTGDLVQFFDINQK